MAVDNSAVRDKNFMAKPRLKKFSKKNRRGGESFMKPIIWGEGHAQNTFLSAEISEKSVTKNEPQKINWPI